jgi:hypothetical protein
MAGRLDEFLVDGVRAAAAQPAGLCRSGVLRDAGVGQGLCRTADCAVTGTMSGNTIGLHEVTSHVHPMAINWGLAAFAVQGERWARLDPAVRQVIERELQRLERAIWSESERETAEGLACNTGDAACRTGRKRRMTLIPAAPEDESLRNKILHMAVIPNWIKRCGRACMATWQQMVGRQLAAAPR